VRSLFYFYFKVLTILTTLLATCLALGVYLGKIK